MSGIEPILGCVCGAITIIEEIIEIRSKMRTADITALDDLLKLMKNYDKYSKKEKKLIRKTLEIFLEQNITANNSESNLEPDLEPEQESKQ